MNHSRELKIISDVSSKVDAIARDIDALSQRLSEHVGGVAALLWAHGAHARAANKTKTAADATADAAAAVAVAESPALSAMVRGVHARQYRAKMDAHWADEALMKCLFTLDQCHGDDDVRVARKTQVNRIKQLIERAEALSARVNRVGLLLKRGPKAPVGDAAAAASAPAPAVSAPTSSAAAAHDAKASRPTTPVSVSVPMETVPSPVPSPLRGVGSLSTVGGMLDSKHSNANANANTNADAKSRPPSPPRSRPHTPPQSKNAWTEQPAAAPSTAPTASAAATKAEEPMADAESTPASGMKVTNAIRQNWPRLRVQFHERDAGHSVQLTAGLPGVRAEDVTVTLDADSSVLTVRGVRRPRPSKPTRARARQPRFGWGLFGGYDDCEDDDDDEEDASHGWFEESFELPSTIDLARVQQQFSDGRLTVTLPRVPRPQPQRRSFAPSASPYGYAGHPGFDMFGGFGAPSRRAVSWF